MALLLVAPTALATVTIDWVTVGDPSNACDTQTQGCFGAVAAEYRIGKYEVTNSQYAEFLNAVAKSDPNGLYNTEMQTNILGGITRSFGPGSYLYGTGFRAELPVLFVSFYDSLRFANWLHNGQPTGAQDNTTTDDGAYTITPGGIAANSIARNPGASVFVPSEDEWYKAAYYDTGGYFDYPAASNVQTSCSVPMAALANSANCSLSVFDLTDRGSYFLAASPSGTFDQGGNAREWNEAIISGSNRGVRGGDLLTTASTLGAASRSELSPSDETTLGFRVASLIEGGDVPSIGPLGIALVCILVGAVGSRRLLVRQ